MTQNRLPDRWHSRDFPVLLEAARLLDAGEMPVSFDDIAANVGFDEDNVIAALQALHGTYTTGEALNSLGGVLGFFITASQSAADAPQDSGPTRNEPPTHSWNSSRRPATKSRTRKTRALSSAPADSSAACLPACFPTSPPPSSASRPTSPDRSENSTR